MAYDSTKGFIAVKIGNAYTVIPNKYISIQSYVSTPHQRQDLDSFQDNEGHLHRNTLEHTRSKVEFNTPIMLEDDLATLDALISSAFTVPKERKLTIRFYCFDTHSYDEAVCYIPDITYTPLLIRADGKVLMDKVRLAFIEY